MEQEAKTAIDTVAVSGGVATYLGWLPDVAALLTIVWLGIRIWESDTVQALVGKNDRGD